MPAIFKLVSAPIISYIPSSSNDLALLREHAAGGGSMAEQTAHQNAIVSCSNPSFYPQVAFPGNLTRQRNIPFTKAGRGGPPLSAAAYRFKTS
jgi:hypothetical protein